MESVYHNSLLQHSRIPLFQQQKRGGITMNKKTSLMMTLIILIVGVEFTFAGAKIIRISGDVKVRRGVEETWQPASIGMLLEDIDTILAGSDGEVILETLDGTTFKLSKNSVLDISDLRKITEKELFLYLMSKKVQRIEPREGKTKLRIGNVSVVHGESKTKPESAVSDELETGFWIQEKNGAKALYEQKFYPNSIIKYHKILDKYNTIEDRGEIHFYLGKSFEVLNQNGQAIDAYQEAIHRFQQRDYNNPNTAKWLSEAQQAIERLKPKK
jgi:hypothetical protein